MFFPALVSRPIAIVVQITNSCRWLRLGRAIQCRQYLTRQGSDGTFLCPIPMPTRQKVSTVSDLGTGLEDLGVFLGERRVRGPPPSR